jgi:hypothetical protein
MSVFKRLKLKNEAQMFKHRRYGDPKHLYFIVLRPGSKIQNYVR